MPNYFSPIIENAIRLASYWHQGQLRKEGEFEYFTHPVAVAFILTKAGFDDEVVAAGLCHDLLEDTDCPADEIRTACSDKVLQIVQTVTEDNRLHPDNQWEERKQRYVEAVRGGSVEAKAVCVADKIHNLENLIAALEEHGLAYFQYFHRGPEEKLWFEDTVCMMLQDTWKHPLVDEYDQLIERFVELLEKLDSNEQNEGDSADSKRNNEIPTQDFDTPDIRVRDEVTSEHPSLTSSYWESEEVTEDSSCITTPQNNETVQRNDNNKENKKKNTSLIAEEGIRYLNEEEAKLILPAVLQLCITKGVVTNPIIQETLRINYVVAFKVLKELKRLHVIDRADSFMPRKVDITQAKRILNELSE